VHDAWHQSLTGLIALFKPLGAIWLVLGVAAGLTAAVSVALGEGQLLPLFGAASVAGIFPGVLLLTATHGIALRARAVEALMFALLAWITGPVVAAIPFILSNEFSVLDGFFEAYSAVTTTGAILMSPEELPRTLVFWRAILSWMGGYATLLLAAAVFAALDRDAPAIRRSVLLTAQPDNVLSHLRLAAVRIAILYCVLTAFAWLGLLIVGHTSYVATILAMSALSTGGYAPHAAELSAYLPNVSIFIIAMACLAGASNISLFWDVLQDRKALLDPDLVGMGVLVAGVAALFFLAQPSGFLHHVFDAVFAVTTSGFAASAGVSPVPVAILFAALIGGAAASTSGGVKVSRVLLLWKRLESELSVLADPSSVARVRFRGREAPDKALIAIWSYVLAFAGVLGIGGVLLSMTGFGFSDAFAAIAAALANAGPLYERAGEGYQWQTASDAAKIILIPVMVLGRLEVLAALAAIWALFLRK
jgi:trk system potassium uptake protein TrkH